jgi:hypothetical protein
LVFLVYGVAWVAAAAALTLGHNAA